MTHKETLQHARATLTDPAKFTSVASALSTVGVEVDPCSPLAVKWSLLGAVRKAVGLDGLKLFAAGPKVVLDPLALVGPCNYHDHASVLAALDKAIGSL